MSRASPERGMRQPYILVKCGGGGVLHASVSRCSTHFFTASSPAQRGVDLAALSYQNSLRLLIRLRFWVAAEPGDVST